MSISNIEELITNLEPVSIQDRHVDPSTLAVVLQAPWSTANARWVVEEGTYLPWEPKREQWVKTSIPGMQYCFFDTVILAFPTEVLEFKLNRDDKEPEKRPKDASALTNAAKAIVGVVPYTNGWETHDNVHYQRYRFNTCNLHPDKVIEILEGVREGRFQVAVDGKMVPIRFVKFDITTNLAGTVVPGTYSDKVAKQAGSQYGWAIKQNDDHTGYSCHSYVVKKDENNQKSLVETKVYNKTCFMLETGSVEKGFGCNLHNFLYSSDDNIRRDTCSSEVLKHGLSRVETRLYVLPASWEGLVKLHITFCKRLIAMHCKSTPLEKSWEMFLKPGHTQVLVLVKDMETGHFKAAFSRWSNARTSRGNGEVWEWSAKTLEKVWHFLQYRTMGNCPIAVYYCEMSQERAKVLTVKGKGLLRVDTAHVGNLFEVNPRGRSQALGVGTTFAEQGLAIPLRTDGYNSKPRTLVLHGNAYIPEDLETVKEAAAKQVRNEKKQQRELKQATERAARAANKSEKEREKRWAKLLEQVEKDQKAVCPSWEQVNHISKLAFLKSPICTAVRPSVDRFGNYGVKVGSKWYKSNSQLNRLLDKKKLPLPFQLHVEDSGDMVSGNKVWGVRLEMCPDDPLNVVLHFD